MLIRKSWFDIHFFPKKKHVQKVIKLHDDENKIEFERQVESLYTEITLHYNQNTVQVQGLLYNMKP